jgi:hypothetical protein
MGATAAALFTMGFLSFYEHRIASQHALIGTQASLAPNATTDLPPFRRVPAAEFCAVACRYGAARRAPYP